MFRKYIFIFLTFGLCAMQGYSQELSKWRVSGYLSNSQSQIFEKPDEDWLSDNLVHHRLNVYYYPTPWLTLSAQARNRLFYGDMIQIGEFFVRGYRKQLLQDPGWIDLSHSVKDEKAYILHTTLDRLYAQFTAGSFEATLGRQRINWGQNFVWNPNDIFNAYSFFDLDYPERPGSDALHLQYYIGFASSVELAAKLNHKDELTAAAKFLFNQWEYDFQVLAGLYNDDDWMAGAGWSGAIGNSAFRGEMSYFHPRDNLQDTSGIFAGALGADYMFSNELYLQAEAIYNQLPEEEGQAGFMGMLGMETNAKQLLFTEYAVFAQASYPLTPLWNTTLAGMVYPDISGFYLGPSVGYSASDNLFLSLNYQYFEGEFASSKKNKTHLVFFRMKWSY